MQRHIRARAGIQRTAAETFVYDVQGGDGKGSRLQDNGRRAINLTADTDLSESLLFTFQASRVVTFDDNLNRRFAQTVFSTVLQVKFFGGRIR